MAAITFDTLRFVHRLKDSGISEVQAEAIAEAFKEASGEAELATKADLREMEGGFKVEIHQLRHEMREMEQRMDGRMREMRAEINGRLSLQQWMLALIVVAEAVPLISKFFGH